MCVILDRHFVVNGQVDIPNCRSNLQDTTELEIIVSWQSADSGKRVKVSCQVRFPDGTDHEFYTPDFTAPGSGTGTYVINISSVVTLTGTYTITGAAVYDYPAGSQRC